MVGVSRAKHYAFAYLFFAPFLLFFILFRIIPFGQSIYLTFFEWDFFSEPNFVGINNYFKLFQDEKFWSSLGHTLSFTLMTVVPLVVLGFLLALLLNRRQWGAGIYRAGFLLPYVFSISVVCLIWQLLYNKNFGFFTSLLAALGVTGPDWLGDSNLAMISVAMTTVWWTLGFNVLIYLSALQQIPQSIYEAASIDGARPGQKMVFITVPLLQRTHVLVLVLQVIASLQIFGQVYIMTKGGPGGKTRVLVQYIYELGFRNFRYGLRTGHRLPLLPADGRGLFPADLPDEG